MTKKNKLLVKFCNIRGEATFKEAKRVLESLGHKVERTNGSHYIFRDNHQNGVTIPVHNNKVKKKYVRKIQNLINEKNEKIQLFIPDKPTS